MGKKPQAETPTKHPEQYLGDLNPNAMAGQNIGEDSPADDTIMAYDIKDLHDLLPDLSADDLKQLRVLRPGSRLEQDATYIDLMSQDRAEIKATGSMVAARGHWFVPKARNHFELWNRLRGIHDVRRTGTEG